MRIRLIAFIVFSGISSSFAQGGANPGESSPIRGLDATDSQVKAGLKDLLVIASSNAIKKTAIENGFWGNEAIKIPLPEKLLNSGKGLRLMGQGLKIEEFEASMNRVAEAAAPSAVEVFSKAISEKTFEDLRGTLNGSGAAATEDLRRSAFSMMQKSFREAVRAVMAKSEVQNQFNALAVQYTGLTLGDRCDIDLADYLSAKILAGIFLLTDQEEANLRGSPQAQDDLLRLVLRVR